MNYYTLSDIDDATVANVASRYRFFASYCSTAYLLCFLLTVITLDALHQIHNRLNLVPIGAHWIVRQYNLHLQLVR